MTGANDPDCYGNVLIWGAQLELGSTATTYTRNDGGRFPPRFDYDPVTLAAKGLLIEEQRTNLLTYSEQFDNAAWIKNLVTVTANTTMSPDGTVDADTLSETATSGEHFIPQQIAKAASNITYTQTAYFKNASGARNFGMSITDGTTGGYGAIFSTTGTVVSASFVVGVVTGWTFVSSSVVPAGNGWYRASLTVTSNTSTRLDSVLYLIDGTTRSYLGSAGNAIFIYGAQLEAGAFATSYIPTVASQVTRTADQTSIVAPNFAPWYNQSEGTFVVGTVTAKPTGVIATGLVIDASDGGITNRNRISFDTAVAAAVTAVGGVTQASISQGYTANAIEKLAYAFAVNDFAFARNGALVGTDTSGTIPTVDRMFIGNAAGSAAFLNGHIRSIQYYPFRASDTQLQALST